MATRRGPAASGAAAAPRPGASCAGTPAPDGSAPKGRAHSGTAARRPARPPAPAPAASGRYDHPAYHDPAAGPSDGLLYLNAPDDGGDEPFRRPSVLYRHGQEGHGQDLHHRRRHQGAAGRHGRARARTASRRAASWPTPRGPRSPAGPRASRSRPPPVDDRPENGRGRTDAPRASCACPPPVLWTFSGVRPFARSLPPFARSAVGVTPRAIPTPARRPRLGGRQVLREGREGACRSAGDAGRRSWKACARCAWSPGCGGARGPSRGKHGGPDCTPRVRPRADPSSPHAAGDGSLLGAHGVGVDGGGGELGVPEPLLHQVERDARRDRRHPEAMA